MQVAVKEGNEYKSYSTCEKGPVNALNSDFQRFSDLA